jgi:hypothetical protein
VHALRGVVTSRAEERAVAHVAHRAALGGGVAHSRIARVLARHGQPERIGCTIVETLAAHRRVISLNFDPDRVRADGLTVEESAIVAQSGSERPGRRAVRWWFGSRTSRRLEKMQAWLSARDTRGRRRDESRGLSSGLVRSG